MLGLSGMELISFTGACMGQRFGSVLETVDLTIQGCSCHWAALTESKGPLLLLTLPISKEAGEGTELEQLTPGISHIIRHHAQHIKMRKKEGRGGTLGVMVFIFPSQCDTCWRAVALEMAKHLPAQWKRWMNTVSLCLCARPLLHLLNCLYLEFSHFYSWFSAPSQWRVVREWLREALLLTRVKPQQWQIPPANQM